MKTLLRVATSLALLTGCMNTASSAEQDTQTTSVNEAVSVAVTSADFEILAGGGWSGTLSYLDYSSGKRASIPVEVSIDTPKARSVSYVIKYPRESQYNARETLKLSRDGKRLNGEAVIERKQTTDRSLEILTQTTGKDDGRPAIIQTRYVLTPTAFKIRKGVKFDDEAEFFNRNEFSLTR